MSSTGKSVSYKLAKSDYRYYCYRKDAIADEETSTGLVPGMYLTEKWFHNNWSTIDGEYTETNAEYCQRSSKSVVPGR